MYIYEDLPEEIQGLVDGSYWLLSVDFEKAVVRIKERRDGYYPHVDLMKKVVDQNLLGIIAEQVWRGNLAYKISPWR